MNIGLCGLGKAGRQFVEYTINNEKYCLKTVLCREESRTAGKTVTDITNLKTNDDLTIQRISEFSNSEHLDVLIDFSNSETTLKLVDICVKHKINLVICPTGFTDSQLGEIKDKATNNDIGIVFAPTLTIGINMLIDSVIKISSLFSDFDFEIVERHSKFKASPTKTAQIISNSICRDSVPISSIRLDGYVGEHEVTATNGSERISIVHESFSREAFVKGSLIAADFIVNHRGYFEMRDIFKKLIATV